MKISNELKVGALTVIGVVVAILGFYYLKGADFSKTKRVYVLLEDAAGIVSANPVAMHGKQIGKVKTVTFEEVGNYNVIFDLSINANVQIPEGSIVKIIELDLLGNKELRIVQPKEFSGYVEEKDTLYGEIKGNLFAAVENKIDPLLAKAEPLMGNVDSLVLNINDLLIRNQKVIDASLASLERTINSFEQVAKRVDNVLAEQADNISAITENAKTITESLAANSGDLDSILNNVNGFTGQLNALELKPIVESAKSSLDEMNQMLTALNDAEGSLGKIIYDDSLYDGIDSTMSSVNALLADLMANPKRYVSFSLIERKDKSK